MAEVEKVFLSVSEFFFLRCLWHNFSRVKSSGFGNFQKGWEHSLILTVPFGDRCGSDECLALIGGGETTQVVQTYYCQEWEKRGTIVDFMEFIRTGVVLWGSTSEQSPSTKTALSLCLSSLKIIRDQTVF